MLSINGKGEIACTNTNRNTVKKDRVFTQNINILEKNVVVMQKLETSDCCSKSSKRKRITEKYSRNNFCQRPCS